MLFLTRKIGETVIIDDHIHLTVEEIRGNSVKIGFSHPKSTRILRKEIFDRVQEENKMAAKSSSKLAEFLKEKTGEWTRSK